MSILGNRILGGAGQQPYTVGRSLRFRASASAYLNRTPASSGTNLTKWTLSFWMKRGALSVQSVPFSAQDTPGTGASSIYFLIGSGNTIGVFYPNTGSTLNVGTAAVLRDPSAWYHVVFTWDTTQVTSTDRIKIYINGVQQTLSGGGTFPSLNATTTWNSNCAHFISKNPVASSDYFDGYFAEIYNIDGQALTPSSFGAYDNNGIWQPIKYGGTYGTNGFYLPFSNTTSTTTLVQDSSGNGNNWTPNNISLTAGTTYDSMIDSPTVSAGSSNYAVLNSLPKNGVQNGTYTTATISNGNLLATGGAINTTWTACSSMVLPTTGKWYFEVTMSATAYGNGAAGLFSLSNSSANCYARLAVGVILNGSTSYAYTGYNTGSTNRIGIAYDADNNKYWQTDVSGTWLNSKTPGVDTTGLVSGLTAAGDYVVGWWYNSGGESNLTASVNFGQQPFSYTQPTGFNALNTYNLPQPTIMNGAKYMAATLWTGDGTNPRTITNTVNNAAFQPDFIWTKVRSTTYSNTLYDDVRGGANVLFSDTTSAESQNYANGQILSFNSNGFNVNSGVVLNQSSQTYVGWQWNAGSGTTSTNTSGSISSLVSVNPSAGFSIVSYTGTGANATVGHNLGVAPSMMIVKNRSAVDNWIIYHASIGNTNFLDFTTAASAASAGAWNNTSPTSSVFTVGTSSRCNGNGNTYVAYCWSAVAGYSAFGSYTGNASTDGPFVYLGFRPRYLLMKSAATANEWYIWDTARNTYNTVTQILTANSSAAESTATAGQPQLDILSNGFKVRDSGNAINSTNMVYAAFAENPFKISRAR